MCMSREVMKLFATEFEVPLGCSGGKTHLAEADKSAKWASSQEGKGFKDSV